MKTVAWPFEHIAPRDVQLEALKCGYGKQGFAYFMRQRLGKTFVAFAEFTMLKNDDYVDWMVVICPNSIKKQWYDAIEQADEYIPICIYSSQRRDKAEYFFNKNKSGGVFIINYESVRSFFNEDGWQKLNPLRTYLVADESTKIADPSAKMTKACLEFAELCEYQRVLTGKPSKGSNNDLWAQLKFIGATSRNFYQHKAMFTSSGGWQGWQGRQTIDNKNTELLKKEMEPFCYIADDRFIKGFNKVYEPLRKIEMLGEQLRMYRQMEKELLVELASGSKITAPIALVKYLRLQQISSGIGGGENEEGETSHFNIVDPDKNPRIKAVKEILDNEINGKLIIVCRFRLSIENLKQELEKDGHKVAVMYGGMGDKLDENKKEFQDGNANILIAQEQVLNFGHTLCGPDENPCEDVIFYENSFSLINRAQCESRPEKYERDNTISYWDFYASQMDRTIIQALIKKEDTSLALMGYGRNKGILYQKEDAE